MGRIWMLLTLVSAVFSIISGNAGETSQAIVTSGRDAVTLTISLVGSMSVWGGLLEILSESGDMEKLSIGMKRLLKGMFGKVTDVKCWEAIGTNLAANLLGVGNAATPAGVRAAQLLANEGENGMRALAMLLTLNNAGLQLLPTTVISIRQAYGAAEPASIWLPSIAAAAVSAVVSVLVLLVIQGREARR